MLGHFQKLPVEASIIFGTPTKIDFPVGPINLSIVIILFWILQSKAVYDVTPFSYLSW